MGVFGIEIGGEGPGDYAADGIGDEAEQAVQQLLTSLEQLGFTITFSAVMAPGVLKAAEAVEQPTTTSGLAQRLDPDGAFKCPDCGLTYDFAGTCVGGEYGHPPVALLPAAEVLNASGVAGVDASLGDEDDVSAAGDADESRGDRADASLGDEDDVSAAGEADESGVDVADVSGEESKVAAPAWPAP